MTVIPSRKHATENRHAITERSLLFDFPLRKNEKNKNQTRRKINLMGFPEPL